jgi:hypothetical protein
MHTHARTRARAHMHAHSLTVIQCHMHACTRACMHAHTLQTLCKIGRNTFACTHVQRSSSPGERAATSHMCRCCQRSGGAAGCFSPIAKKCPQETTLAIGHPWCVLQCPCACRACDPPRVCALELVFWMPLSGSYTSPSASHHRTDSPRGAGLAPRYSCCSCARCVDC